MKEIHPAILPKIKLKQKRQTVFSSSERGFSLVEVMVSVFIFSMIVSMISGTFSAFLKNYSEAKRNASNIENAQFAMNLMAKTVRTSNVKDFVSDQKYLELYDYAQGKCIKYAYLSGDKKIQVSESVKPDPASCDFSNMSNSQDVTGDFIENVNFYVTPSGASTYGKVTMAISLKETSQRTSSLRIQTTVSLRN